MTMQHAIQRHLVEPCVEAQLKALKSMYPGWRITYDAATGRWSAAKRAPITDAQADAGVVAGFFSGNYEAFAEQLAKQADPHTEETS
ncbi:hypothetical protein AB0F88_40390 [Streptosporangium sp. NPDC023963]|uniref:hypothetical protein n=1 Tax=Streptosporangium sp. NPDC023963 TaxID=3155608 RepID=UPI00341661C6